MAAATLVADAAPVATGPDGDLPRYELALRLDPDAGILSGTARVTLPATALDGGRARFTVAGNGVTLQIDAVRSADGAVLEHSQPDADGRIEVRAGDSRAPVTVAFDYHREVTAAQLQPFGYWAFAPFGPSTWAYPEIVLPDGHAPRFADFEVTLEHPDSLAVITTGGHGGEGTIRDGQVRVSYRAEHVEGFAIVAGEGFRVTRDEGNGVPVVAFYDPQYEDRFARVIAATKEAADWYRRTYGFFPLREVGIIQGHPQWGGGYPLPNLYAFHLGILDDDFISWITAHELGHYYWGLYVLGDQERLDWLELAMGIWADHLYLAERNGRSLPEQWRSEARQGDQVVDYLAALVADQEQRLGITSDREQGLGFDYNSLIRHGKAATGLFLESMQLGPERFLQLQRRILREYEHRPLPEADFVRLLADAGLDGAPAFFDAWKRNGARIDAAVTSVAPDEESGGWTVEVSRTGPVPYPITVEIDTDEGGDPVRRTLAADADEDTFAVATRPTSVRLDPDGIVPMWNSSSPAMRSAFARALDRAGIDGAFLPLAREVLAESPADDYLRYRLTRRLFWLGRWQESAELWPEGRGCDGYDACLAGIYAARARARSGDVDGARAMLETLRAGAQASRAASFWETVSGEVAGGRRR